MFTPELIDGMDPMDYAKEVEIREEELARERVLADYERSVYGRYFD